MNTYDFSRSFIRWTSARISHTPRLQVDATCELTSGGETTEFFLSAMCAGETMYAAADLIQLPAYEFAMICIPNDQYMFIKYHADDQRNIAEVHRVGEVMSTHDGKGAPVMEMTAEMAHFGTVREVKGYDEIREAILGGKLLNAETEYVGEDGRTRVVLRYPVKICNVANDQRRWQVDTGSILLPDLAATAELPVGRMRMGYIVFNEWDWAEVVLRRIQADEDGSPGSHFSASRRLTVRNALYCAD